MECYSIFSQIPRVENNKDRKIKKIIVSLFAILILVPLACLFVIAFSSPEEAAVVRAQATEVESQPKSTQELPTGTTEPTETSEPTATDTPEPTTTPKPTATKEPTATIRATAVPTQRPTLPPASPTSQPPTPQPTATLVLPTATIVLLPTATIEILTTATSAPTQAPAPTVPPPPPPPLPTSPPPVTQDCTPGYSPCIPPGADVDCAGGSGNGPRYVQGPVTVDQAYGDPYDLDRDNDGVGCEN